MRPTLTRPSLSLSPHFCAVFSPGPGQLPLVHTGVPRPSRWSAKAAGAGIRVNEPVTARGTTQFKKREFQNAFFWTWRAMGLAWQTLLAA
jgi:hypothetical protein